MKIIIIIISLAFVNQIYSQNENNNIKYSLDSDITVYQYKDNLKKSKVAYYLNGVFINEEILKGINPDLIESVNVEKGTFDINGEKFYGKILLKTKNTYKPELVSINQLIEKYLDIDDKPVIIQVDDTIINKEYSQYKIDEKFVLKIIVEEVITSDKDLKLNLVKIITKTPENIKEANTIMIK